MQQRRSRLIATLLTTAVLITGCRRTPTAATRPTSPTPTAAPQPAAAPPSTLIISGKPYQFPPARLIAESSDSGVLAQVFSDGASAEGSRDGFYLELPLDVPDPAQLDGASWQFESSSNDRSDESLSAITVNGGGNQLQARSVTITFHDLSTTTVEVRIDGTFNVFQGRDGATSTGVVPVSATLVATRRGT